MISAQISASATLFLTQVRPLIRSFVYSSIKYYQARADNSTALGQVGRGLGEPYIHLEYGVNGTLWNCVTLRHLAGTGPGTL